MRPPRMAGRETTSIPPTPDHGALRQTDAKNAPAMSPGAFPLNSEQCSACGCVEIGASANPLLAGGRLVLGNQVGGHATAVLNVVPVLARPVPDLGRVQRRAGPGRPYLQRDRPATGRRRPPCGRRGRTFRGPSRALRVLRVQVDLVFSTVEREPRFPRRPAVNVVYEECRDLLGHLDSAFLVSTAIINDCCPVRSAGPTPSSHPCPAMPVSPPRPPSLLCKRLAEANLSDLAARSG